MVTSADIRINGLGYSYGETTVLSDVSFEVEKGAFYIILGPNGSGKTTLMKLAAGVMKKKCGSIEISGKLLENYSRKQLAGKLAFVPQLIPVDFPFTVREVVMSGRAPHQGLLGFEGREDSKRVEEAMAFTDIDHLKDRKIDRLSGGERQRVFIAAALCQNPEIILLDEPTSALDLAHQLSVMDLMEKLKHQRNITIMMISHDINLAAMYADKILLLKEGKVVNEGSPEKVLNRHDLEAVYECCLSVDESAFCKSPRIIPVPGKYAGNV